MKMCTVAVNDATNKRNAENVSIDFRKPLQMKDQKPTT